MANDDEPAAGSQGAGSIPDATEQVRTAEAIENSIQKMANAYRSLGEVIGGVGAVAAGVAIDLAKAFGESLAEEIAVKGLSKGIEAIKDATEKIDNLGAATKAARGIVESFSGGSMIALREFYGDASGGARQFSTDLFKTVNDLGTATFQAFDGSGKSITLGMMQIGSAAEIAQSYVDAVVDDVRLFKFASEAMNADLASSVFLAQKNIGLSTRDINTIFQTELSRTGKISGDTLVQFEKAVVATAELTGQSVEKTSQDMMAIMRDFQHFGDMTEARAASLSVTLSKLGMSVGDLTSVAGKFQTFEGASQAMSNLAASTGATLDTLELFRLANEDQEGFVLSLREQLEAQGLEFENMNVIQQRMLAQSFGLDPRALQRLMQDGIGEVESAQADLEDKTSKMTDAETKKRVATLRSVVDASKSTAEDVLKRTTEAVAATEDFAFRLEKAMTTNSQLMKTVIDDLEGVKASALKRQKEFDESLDKIITKQKEAIENIAKMRKAAEGAGGASGQGPGAVTSGAEGAAPIAQDTDGVQRMGSTGYVGFTSGDYYAAALNPMDLVKQVLTAFPPATSPVPAAASPTAATPALAPTTSPASQRVEHVIRFVVSGDGTDIGDALAKSVGRQLATAGVVIDGIDTRFKTNNPQIETGT